MCTIKLISGQYYNASMPIIDISWILRLNNMVMYVYFDMYFHMYVNFLFYHYFPYIGLYQHQ